MTRGPVNLTPGTLCVCFPHVKTNQSTSSLLPNTFGWSSKRSPIIDIGISPAKGSLYFPSPGKANHEECFRAVGCVFRCIEGDWIRTVSHTKVNSSFLHLARCHLLLSLDDCNSVTNALNVSSRHRSTLIPYVCLPQSLSNNHRSANQDKMHPANPFIEPTTQWLSPPAFWKASL